MVAEVVADTSCAQVIVGTCQPPICGTGGMFGTLERGCGEVVAQVVAEACQSPKCAKGHSIATRCANTVAEAVVRTCQPSKCGKGGTKRGRGATISSPGGLRSSRCRNA